jgi:hypothetical protein
MHGKISDNERGPRFGRGKCFDSRFAIAKSLHVVAKRFQDYRGQFQKHRLVIHNVNQGPDGLLSRIIDLWLAHFQMRWQD